MGGQVPEHDIDPGDARTVADFALCLRRLRAQAGHPSLRDLELRARRSGKRLPRSSVSDALAGRWLPRKELVLRFIQACGIDPADDTRWASAWMRLADHNFADAPAMSTDRVGLAEVNALMEAEQMLAYAAQARRAADLEIASLKASAQQEADRQLAAAAQTLHSARLTAELARDVAKTGLRRVGATFLPDLDWAALFADATELDIFMAYGQTWRNLHAPELTRMARRPRSRIRVFLTDPDDQLTVSTLAHRFRISDQELRTRIEATRRDYLTLQQLEGADVQLRYWTGDRLFSFFRLDRTAILGLYSHSRSRASAVPVIVCEGPGELFQFVLDELSTIEQQSRPC
jgi:hypothetical protein